MIKNILALIGTVTVVNYAVKFNNWIVERRVNEIISRRVQQ